jgi:ABC-type phosphate transport system substrate-binding protein
MNESRNQMSVVARICVRAALATLLAASLLFASASAVAQESVASSAIAIVVHKDTEVDNLSLHELRNIFMANQQFWSDRKRIILLVRAPKSEERDFVLNTIYQMDEAQFRQYWIAKMFRAEVPRGPKIVFSTDMTVELVVAIPGSISFINADEVSDDVKVVRIDGKLPTEEGYPLQ